MHMPIRVALADDHVLVRQGLKSLLEREEFKVVAEAADGQEAVTQAVSLHPDITIMDISMPMLNGIDAARELGRACPKTKVILLTQHEEDQYILEALEAGVKGYVLKNQVASDLVFQHISLHPSLQGLKDILIFFMLREQDHLRFRTGTAEFPCCIYPV